MSQKKTVPAPRDERAAVAEFESRIAQVGEHKARMERLFALLGGAS